MSADRDNAPFALDNPGEASRLREALHGAGYETQHIAALLKAHPEGLFSFRAAGKERALALLRASGGSPLDVLVRLFLLGEAVDLASARRAFGPSGADHWLTAGLLERRGDGVAASLQLIPFEQLVLAIDPWWVFPMKANHVLGVGGPTLNLAQMTVRRPARSTLDLGSGCGIQAFLAAPHSGEVVGVDRNPRAVNVAAFNAQLNGVTNATFEVGDLYSPVRDRRFDLIVANPPYVISPESRYLYRDSGLKGDEIAQRVIREGSPLLEQGGYLQVICEWAHLAGQNWHARLAGWFNGTGCDVWVTTFTTVDTGTHAELWLQSNPEETAESLPARLDEWLDYYKHEGIEAISDGVMTLRKRSGGDNWLRIDKAPQRIGPCGPSVERGFAAVDFLQAASEDESLMRSTLRAAPELCWEQRSTPTGDGWQVTQHQLFLTAGLAYRGEVDRRCLTLVDRCRGRMTMKEVLSALSAEAGSGAPAEAEWLALARALVEQGFLLPQ